MPHRPNGPEHVPGRTCQVPPPCDPARLLPLLARLQEAEPASGRLDFPAGTLLADGRLDLCKQALGPQGAQQVASALFHNRWVKSLLMGADSIGPEGARAVAGLLRENGTIETVYLGCNHIGPEGTLALCTALQHNDRVRGLWLKRNELGVPGARAIAGLLRRTHSLRTLDLVSNDLGAEGAALIAGALAEDNRSVETLYLCGNRIGATGTAPLCDLLRNNPVLTGLYLSTNRLSDQGAALLAEGLRHNTTLTTLALSSNDIGPTGAKSLADALSGHPALRTLELGFSPATAVLGEKPNRLGDEGAIAIAGLLRKSPLFALDLGQNGIGETGMRQILDALEENHSLTRLVFGTRLPDPLRLRLRNLLQRNQHSATAVAERTCVSAIRSVYRTARRKPVPAA